MRTKTIILIMVIILIGGSIYYLESMKVRPGISEERVLDLRESLLKNGKYLLAPELSGISGYINTPEGLKISDLRGKVVLIDFWTYSCINCIRTFPYLIDWYDKYEDKGFVIIGVHTPEFQFEKKYENVKRATEENGIKYPVVQDNDYVTWNLFRNRFWPRKYLIDSEGYIRYDHIGEGAYAETELKIQELLSEIGEDISDMEIEKDEVSVRYAITPELYAGYSFALPRNQDIGNKEGLQQDLTIEYTLPDSLRRDTIYLTGKWKNNPDNLELIGSEGNIVLDFSAKEVNIVADSVESKEMEIIVDGISSSIIIDTPKLYNVYEGEMIGARLELKVKEGFSFNAFTFG